MNPVWYFVGAVVLSEAYERYVSPANKQRWQDFVGIHHGEAGVLATLGGIATNSPGLVYSGLGLAAHDHNDAGKWFKKSVRDKK